MKTTSFFLFSAGLALLGSAAWMIDTGTKPNKVFQEYKTEYAREESMEIAGARMYHHQLMANQLTGEVDYKDVQRARDEAARLASITKKTRAFGNMSWQETGPNNIGGRTRTFLVDKNNPNKLYMGMVSGGFWTSTNNGNDWTKMPGNDTMPALAISSIAQAANGDLYYGTGEGIGGFAGTSFPQQLFQLGEGIFKSTDGGVTFTQLAATKPANPNSSTDQWSYVNKIVAHPTDANKLIAATYGGLKVTTNGGTTWARPTGLTTVNAHFLDVEMSTDGSRVVAGTTNNLYISNDGGTTFGANIMGTNGLPSSGGNDRVEIAIAPNDANYIYLCLSATNGTLRGVYRSTDGGQNWTAIGLGGSAIFNPLGNQGDYNIALAVHPTNKDMLFLGGQLELTRWTPGTNWKTIAYWQPIGGFNSVVHADMHVIAFNPSNPENMYVGTDGGFYRTFNCSAPEPDFAEKNKNYATAQCYGVSANLLGHIVYGTQDNGSGLIGQEVNSVQESRRLTGGDGMRNAISDYAPGFVFTTLYYGDLNRAADGGQGSGSFKSFFDKNIDNNTDEQPDEGGLWVAPLDLQEQYNPATGEIKSVFLFGTNSSVWMTQDALKGNAVWFRLYSPGAQGFSALTMTKDGKTVYAGTQGGKVYRIDVPDLWTSRYQYADTIANMPIGSPYTYPLRDSIKVTQITSSLFNGRFVTDLSCDASGNNLLVTVANYGNSAYIFKSTNARDTTSVTFSDATGNLPKMPVYSAVHVGGSNSKYIIGTELGIWGSDNGGSTWTELNKMNADPSTWHPRVGTYEVIEKPMYKNSTSGYIGSIIYTGTHGRGTFRSTSMSTFFPTMASLIGEHRGKIDLYPNPANTTSTLEYTAEKASRVQISIYSLTGTLVKQLQVQTQQGQNKISLDLYNLAAGGYIVYLNDQGLKASKTLIKQ